LSSHFCNFIGNRKDTVSARVQRENLIYSIYDKVNLYFRLPFPRGPRDTTTCWTKESEIVKNYKRFEYFLRKIGSIIKRITVRCSISKANRGCGNDTGGAITDTLHVYTIFLRVSLRKGHKVVRKTALARTDFIGRRISVSFKTVVKPRRTAAPRSSAARLCGGAMRCVPFRN